MTKPFTSVGTIPTALLREAFEHLSTAVLIFGPKHEMIAMNPAAENMLELSSRQAQGMLLDRLFPVPSRCVDVSVKALELQQVLSERGVMLTLGDGRRLHVDCTVTPLSEAVAAGTFMLELTDVEQRLRMTREDQLLAQNESTRIVLRGLAHEIRNPLGGLRGAAQLLAREFSDPGIAEYSAVIIAEADRLRSLLERLLGPRQPPRRAPVNVHEVTERVRALVHAEAPPYVIVERDYDPSIPEVMGDYDMLIQAVLNIARNAVQALNAPGRVLLRTRVQRNAHVGSRLHRLVAQIDVIDDGPGIPEELQTSLFYPMVTGRAEGTGLGLSIAQSLVAHHGGLIECSSTPGLTRFSVLLPIES